MVLYTVFRMKLHRYLIFSSKEFVDELSDARRYLILKFYRITLIETMEFFFTKLWKNMSQAS